MPSLSDRLRTAQPNAANKGGCVTCQWWSQLSRDTQRLINEWLDSNYSTRQLHDIVTAPSDGPDPVLNISITGFRLHLNHHDEKCRTGE